MMVIPIVIDMFGTVIKGLVQELEELEIKGQVETIQTAVLFKLVRILGRAWETWGELLSIRLQWKTIP